MLELDSPFDLRPKEIGSFREGLLQREMNRRGGGGRSAHLNAALPDTHKPAVPGREPFNQDALPGHELKQFGWTVHFQKPGIIQQFDAAAPGNFTAENSLKTHGITGIRPRPQLAQAGDIGDHNAGWSGVLPLDPRGAGRSAEHMSELQ